LRIFQQTLSTSALDTKNENCLLSPCDRLPIKFIEFRAADPHPNPLPEGEGVAILSLWERVRVRAVYNST